MAANQMQLSTTDAETAGAPTVLRDLFWKHLRCGDRDEAQLVGQHMLLPVVEEAIFVFDDNALLEGGLEDDQGMSCFFTVEPETPREF